ncbi:MAG: DUF3048 domain-containing protein [Armatimonadetes bacterium]|nr:DUF3048 domain-containing protein [Armatimonadota bacterium]
MPGAAWLGSGAARRAWIAAGVAAALLLVALLLPQAARRLFGPDVSGLPTLHLPAPGKALSSVSYREVTSDDLLSACASPRRRPIAVMVSNDPAARPASGLSAACLIYEVPIEAALPRLMAVYGDALPALVGPVRSVRPAFLELAAEFDGVLAHAGQSLEALNFIRDRRYPVVNEFWTPLPFHRTRERKMPHNLYVAPLKVARWMADHHVDAATRQPAPAVTEAPQGEPASIIRIEHPPGYGTTFTFADGAYRRFVQDAETTDAAGGEVRASTVIVQSVRWRGWRRGKTDVSAVSVIGKGAALIFTGRRVVEAQWEKARDRAPTRFTTATGAPLRLSSGPIWVVLARSETKVQWK